MPITETFDEAVSKFTDFLQQQKAPSDLRWLCREEITGYRRQLFVHPSPSSDNGELYRHKFSYGVAIGHSVSLAAACFADGLAYCYVWVSSFDFDPEHPESTGGLGFQAYVDSHESGHPKSVIRTRSVLSFHLHRAWSRVRGESPAVEDFATRSELQTLAANTRHA